jgi:hypothetical protein
LLIVAADGSGYRAADIKHHRCLDADQSGFPAYTAPLDRPGWEDAARSTPVTARKHRDDLLQLAHYQRMLEAAQLAAADGRHAAIIGVDGLVTWYDLDPRYWLTPSTSAGRRRKRRSTMEVYDFEFDFRLDIIAVAIRGKADPSTALLVTPVRIGECAECPWWSWCGPHLAGGSGDVSLLPRVGWQAWRNHRDHGVTSQAELGSLAYRTAALVAAGVDLRRIMAAVGTLPDETRSPPLSGPGNGRRWRVWRGLAYTRWPTRGHSTRARRPTVTSRRAACPSRSTVRALPSAIPRPIAVEGCSRSRCPAAPSKWTSIWRALPTGCTSGARC